MTNADNQEEIEKIEEKIKDLPPPQPQIIGRTISYCIDANYWKGTTVEDFLRKKRRQLVLD